MLRLLSTLFLLWGSLAQAEILEGRVVGVHDGDTITVLSAERQDWRVRLAEIDAPELHQPWGQRSKQSLSDLVYDHSVRVLWKQQDRYGRIVGRVYVGDIDVSAEQVRRGLAWVYERYATDPSLVPIEAEARADRRGLWVDPAPVPPWEYRHTGFKPGT